jgi:hypothetical protein
MMNKNPRRAKNLFAKNMLNCGSKFQCQKKGIFCGLIGDFEIAFAAGRCALLRIFFTVQFSTIETWKNPERYSVTLMNRTLK